ncbi:MAG: GNAT family N-acetyltransferase [Armatimonadota bacterium]
MANADKQFEFIDTGILRDGELELVLTETDSPDPSRGWLPLHRFEMRVDNQMAGRIYIRIGNNHDIETYFGHMGYAVEPEFRGHHYAERACRLLFPLAKAHGLNPVWIMCDPNNTASRRTCERLGATLVEIIPLPEDNVLYKDGVRECCRYRIDLESDFFADVKQL